MLNRVKHFKVGHIFGFRSQTQKVVSIGDMFFECYFKTNTISD